MASMLTENPVSPSVPKVDGQGHVPVRAGQDTLFPDARPSFRPAKPGPRIGIKEWVHQFLSDFKGIGGRILSAERKELAEEKRVRLTPEVVAEIEGDPTEDGKAIGKILKDGDRRRFDLDWLDHFEAEFGQDWMGEFLTFLNDRYGFGPVVRIPDPQRDAERLARIEKQAKQGIELFSEVLNELRAGRAQR